MKHDLIFFLAGLFSGGTLSYLFASKVIADAKKAAALAENKYSAVVQGANQAAQAVKKAL